MNQETIKSILEFAIHVIGAIMIISLIEKNRLSNESILYGDSWLKHHFIWLFAYILISVQFS